MAFNKYIKHYLTYPFMWVMLLWAITLPGHERAVYSYLVNGSAAAVAPGLGLANGTQGHDFVKQQIVQVFLDARIASSLTLLPQQGIKHDVRSFAFTFLANHQPRYTTQLASAALLARLLPGNSQPNAP